MKVRAVCFDFGGTLDAPGVHWLERFAELYRDAGIERSWDEVRSAFDHATQCAYRDSAVSALGLEALIDFHVGRQAQHLGLQDEPAIARISAAFVEASRAAMRTSRVVLEQLRPCFVLGVISNFYGNVDRILAEAGIAELLGVIIDSNRVGVSKPDAAVFEMAAQRLGLVPADVLYVGDSFDKDVRGAHAAGMRTAWLTGARERVCPAADLVDIHLRSLAELAGHLQ